MARNTKKTKVKKNRSYKIQKLAGVPSLNIRGKFLEKLGVTIGSHWEMIETQEQDTIILKKVPQAMTLYREALYELEQSKKAMMVCESRANYLAEKLAEKAEKQNGGNV